MAPVDHIDYIARLKHAAEMKVAANPALIPALLAGGAGALGGGAIAASLVHNRDVAERERVRNTAFGAGAAAGLTGPQIIDALHATMHRGNP